jgi:TetR/AcrR family transcriptional regulator, ethionamide resistance regulator
MAAQPSSGAAPARGRRASRVSAQEREVAILETAERLLEQRSVQDISVDDLARGAGISRPSFYFYFPSKEAVFLTLINRLVEQADVGREVIERIHEDPPARWREGLQVFFDIFGSHRAVVRAGAELRAVNAEARELWSSVMDNWVGYAATAIEAERARGAAPPGADARQLAIALVSMNERVQYATFAAEAPCLPDEAVMDVLLEVWLKAIYGEAAVPGA